MRLGYGIEDEYLLHYVPLACAMWVLGCDEEGEGMRPVWLCEFYVGSPSKEYRDVDQACGFITLSVT